LRPLGTHTVQNVTTEKALLGSVLVIIPARGGSKGIPLKNLQAVGNRTLLARAIETAHACPLVEHVLVSTDSDLISMEALQNGAMVAKRPQEIAGDTASSETALLDALQQFQASGYELPQVTVFLQCTSPFIDPRALNSAIGGVLSGRADVVFSAVEDHSFRWTASPDGAASAVGHDAGHRVRRQDLPPSFRETGAFYAMRTEGFLEHRNRFFGRIETEQVRLSDSFEIDTYEDLEVCRALEARSSFPVSPSAPVELADLQRAGLEVDALVTDFDGVHTNDTAILSVDGSEHVQVSRSDGMGVSLLRSTGIPMLILSTEANPIVSARAKKLGVDVLQGITNKAEALTAWMSANRLDPSRVAYVGNDVNDLPAMALVGWPIAVADARTEALGAARIVLSSKGGQGAVREVCDLVALARTSPALPTSQDLSNSHVL
jgi:YrbI family 3-deoxy-D-manno-octulosonate 8-phosphate phosphatase